MINAAPVDTPARSRGGLTELVMTDFGDQQGLILSMAAQLSQQNDGRWLTWITDDRGLYQRLRQYPGLVQKGVRLVHCTEASEQLWIIWDALSLGNSHTVIASPGALQDRALAELEQAALKGASQGILVRYRHGLPS